MFPGHRLFASPYDTASAISFGIAIFMLFRLLVVLGTVLDCEDNVPKKESKPWTGEDDERLRQLATQGASLIRATGAIS